MKWSLILPAFLAGLHFRETSSCRPPEPVIICYTGPNCTGTRVEELVTIGECLTLAGPNASTPGSCICADPEGEDGADITFCATTTSYDGKRLLVGREQVVEKPPDSGNYVGIGLYDTKDFNLDVYMGGEPHVKKWNGEWYDWHGQCDAVMLHAPKFAHGLGLDIHVRLRIRHEYSYIESAAVRIGDSVFEVESFGQYALNGVVDAELPYLLYEFPLSHKRVNEHDDTFTIDLGSGALLIMKTHKDIVSVGIVGALLEEVAPWFANSTGLMGSYPNGEMLARDGTTVFNEPNDMGQEWQVRDSDPVLFMTNDHPPQFPDKCLLPDPTSATKRRLGQSSVTTEQAEAACSHWPTKDSKARCVYDVIAMQDLGMADQGAV